MTGFHEIFQSAPQISQKAQEIGSLGNMVRLALEARKALTDPNLFSFLRESGHPYGLLLNQMTSIGPSLGPSLLLSSSSMVEENPNMTNQLGEISSTGISNSYVEAFPDPTSRSIIGLLLSSSAIFWSVDSASGEHGLSTESCGANIFDPEDREASFKGSSFSSSHPLESSDLLMGVEKDEIKIGKRHIGLGAVGINLTKFSGQETYGIKSFLGEPMAEIKPQDPLAFIHVNRLREELRKMSPLERVHKIKKDLIGLFGLMDNEALLNNLKPEQQAVLTAARSAVIVGISHLVPIFRRRTGLPFWKLDALPEVVQKFHCLDSQLVSNKFGGSRKVRIEDVEMMVITPKMRQQLVANYT